MDQEVKNGLIAYLTENFSLSDLANRLIDTCSESQLQELLSERSEWESRDLDGDE